MPRTLFALAALLATFAAIGVGCGGDDDGETATNTPTATPEDTGGEEASACESVQAPEPKEVTLKKPKQRLKPGRSYVATVSTNCGEFEIKLDADRAPKTGGSFKALVDAGFYDGLTFHRVSPGFVIQGGDPAGNGTGGPGYSVIEAPPKNLTYDAGVVAMAKSQLDKPGQSGSQFFVVVSNSSVALPPDYALLGKVSAGMDVVDLIGTQSINEDESPAEPIVIRSITIDG